MTNKNAIMVELENYFYGYPVDDDTIESILDYCEEFGFESIDDIEYDVFLDLIRN